MYRPAPVHQVLIFDQCLSCKVVHTALPNEKYMLEKEHMSTLCMLGLTWIIAHAVQSWEHWGTDTLIAGSHHFAEVVCCERHEHLVARVASQLNIAHQKHNNLCLAESPACPGWARPGLQTLLCSCCTAAASLRMSHPS